MEEITMEKLAEYKVNMQIAKEKNDKYAFMKYYELYKLGYKKITGNNFEDRFVERE